MSLEIYGNYFQAAAPQLPSQFPPPEPRPLPIGSGQFSDQVAGQQPQQDIDLQLAQMANDAYTLAGPDGTTGTQSSAELEAAGWNRLQPEGDHLVDADGNRIAIDPKMLEDSKTGFRAAIYQNQQGQYVVAFGGTDPKSFPDIRADAVQAVGQKTEQYNQAERLAARAELVFQDGNVVFTGHSLGGGLASYAALSTDASAVTFNSAGLSNESLRSLGFSPNATRDAIADSGQVRRYVVDGDPLTVAQQRIPGINGTPDAVGYQLNVAAPPGTGFFGSHGGSGDGTTYVEALRSETPRAPADPSWNLPTYVAEQTENVSEFGFNTLSNAIDMGASTIRDGVNTVKDVGSEISNVVNTDFAQGDYVEGGLSIVGDVADGALDFTGKLTSNAISTAGKQVENLTTLGGSAVRDLGSFLGVEGPANAVAGFVEGAGELVSDGADKLGQGVEWATDKLGDGVEIVADFAGDLGQGVVDGAVWAGGKVVEGAQWAGNKVVEGAQWAGDKVVEGAQWAGGKVVEGAQWAGGKIADGAKWAGEKLNPLNWF